MTSLNFAAGAVVLAVAGLAGTPAMAQIVISAPATNWRVVDYIPQGLTIFFSGSQCANGLLTLPSNAVQNDKNMLLATIATSKAIGTPVIVYYNYTASPQSCVITIFGLDTN